MRLVSYVADGQVRPGVLEGENVCALDTLTPSILDLLDATQGDFSEVEQALQTGRLPIVGKIDALQLKPPVYYPRKMLCVAGNFVDHIKEGGVDMRPEFTQAPWLFCVPPTQLLIGHGEPVRLNPNYQKTDYEGELAIVIGRKAKRIQAEQAADYIAGYTIFNDVSERTPDRKSVV